MREGLNLVEQVYAQYVEARDRALAGASEQIMRRTFESTEPYEAEAGAEVRRQLTAGNRRRLREAAFEVAEPTIASAAVETMLRVSRLESTDPADLAQAVALGKRYRRHPTEAIVDANRGAKMLMGMPMTNTRVQ